MRWVVYPPHPSLNSQFLRAETSKPQLFTSPSAKNTGHPSPPHQSLVPLTERQVSCTITTTDISVDDISVTNTCFWVYYCFFPLGSFYKEARPHPGGILPPHAARFPLLPGHAH